MHLLEMLLKRFEVKLSIKMEKILWH